jgi:hypothetical protein
VKPFLPQNRRAKKSAQAKEAKANPETGSKTDAANPNDTPFRKKLNPRQN